MNLKQMRQEVSVLILDHSFDSDTIDSYINDAIQYAARQVAIPSLKRMGVVETHAGREYVTINSIGVESFNGILRKVVNSDNVIATVHANLEELMEKYPSMDNVGSVSDVALEGNMLWYQRVPEAASELTVVFYTDPSSLTKDADSPGDFPSDLHRRLFVMGAAWLIWDLKEQDEDGKKPNTINYFYHSFEEGNKTSGITKLREYIAKRKVHHINSTWSV